jgi:hypothetical protein
MDVTDCIAVMQALSIDFQGLEACLSQLPLHEVLGVEASLFDSEASLPAEGSTATSQRNPAAQRTTVPPHSPATRPHPPNANHKLPPTTSGGVSSRALSQAAGQAVVRETQGAGEHRTPQRGEVETGLGSGRQEGSAPPPAQKREGVQQPAVAQRREGNAPPTAQKREGFQQPAAARKREGNEAAAVRQIADEAQTSEQRQPSGFVSGSNPQRVAGGGDAVDALLDMLLAGDDADVAPAKPPPVRNPKPAGTLGGAGASRSSSVKGFPQTRGGGVGAAQSIRPVVQPRGPNVRQDAFRGGDVAQQGPNVRQDESRGGDVAPQGQSREVASQLPSRGEGGTQESRGGVVAQLGFLHQGLPQVGSKGQGLGHMGPAGQSVAQKTPEGQTVGPPQASKKSAEEELLDWLDD